jgi:hypothetical protein
VLHRDVPDVAHDEVREGVRHVLDAQADVAANEAERAIPNQRTRQQPGLAEIWSAVADPSTDRRRRVTPGPDRKRAIARRAEDRRRRSAGQDDAIDATDVGILCQRR